MLCPNPMNGLHSYVMDPGPHSVSFLWQVPFMAPFLCDGCVPWFHCHVMAPLVGVFCTVCPIYMQWVQLINDGPICFIYRWHIPLKLWKTKALQHWNVKKAERAALKHQSTKTQNTRRYITLKHQSNYTPPLKHLNPETSKNQNTEIQNIEESKHERTEASPLEGKAQSTNVP